jgi:hypothetical protein
MGIQSVAARKINSPGGRRTCANLKRLRIRTIDVPSERGGYIRRASLTRCLATRETGEFIAVDADTGKIVWEFQAGSGINAMPVTYTHQGRQYVTVLSGIGGLYWNIWREQLKDKVAPGGSVWTFALLPE